ncbi:hypothetical protein Acor_81150 [Acrocarpospora corrugata]|uniref:Uncharacterized protein n=1 Tax=Acrocarpospora corrugata TaxID=35763 RepID=A0A5M3WB58_9ACTN|nr:hypothetical protein Acor_81150 [Acrocarpospora corrugata]
MGVWVSLEAGNVRPRGPEPDVYFTLLSFSEKVVIWTAVAVNCPVGGTTAGQGTGFSLSRFYDFGQEASM